MSGSVIRLVERERANRLAEAVLREVGIPRSELGRLQTLPMEQLRAAIEPAEKSIGPAAQPLFDRYAFGRWSTAWWCRTSPSIRRRRRSPTMCRCWSAA